jgi:hypothetical protein
MILTKTNLAFVNTSAVTVARWPLSDIEKSVACMLSSKLLGLTDACFRISCYGGVLAIYVRDIS